MKSIATMHGNHLREIETAEKQAQKHWQKMIFREKVHWKIESNRSARVFRHRKHNQDVIAAVGLHCVLLVVSHTLTLCCVYLCVFAYFVCVCRVNSDEQLISIPRLIMIKRNDEKIMNISFNKSNLRMMHENVIDWRNRKLMNPMPRKCKQVMIKLWPGICLYYVGLPWMNEGSDCGNNIKYRRYEGNYYLFLG